MVTGISVLNFQADGIVHQPRWFNLPLHTATAPEPGRQQFQVARTNKVLPILKRQGGFVDETVIVSDTEPNLVLALSFWNTREDAQRYEREQFDTVQKTVQHLLETAPAVRTFDVHTSTARRVAADRAA
jgi:heme-degrading monooxygenase HmoA